MSYLVKTPINYLLSWAQVRESKRYVKLKETHLYIKMNNKLQFKRMPPQYYMLKY